MKASVVILNWNGRKLLEQFLPTVLRHTLSQEAEVVVADNDSSDDSLLFLTTHFPHVPVISLDKNYGFAEGYNRALQQVDSEYVVLLNSDVETTENWLTTLVDYLDTHPEVSAVQPKILAQTRKTHFEYAGACGGFIDRFGYPFCRGRILENVEQDVGQYNTVVPVFWASGACLCIRRQDYFEAGGLDARFFAHMEEIDLCWRLNARGKRVECVPQSVVYHVGAASLTKENPRKTYLNFRNNLLMLYKNSRRRSIVLVFTVRLILDALACTHLLMKGKLDNAKAVVEAHRDFMKMWPDFRRNRRENLSKRVVGRIPAKFRRSILWNYYVKGRRTFGDLTRNP
ncbi:MAG: glycosyltransferase family 2 protein [Bacteroidia bacterium]|nr:glycosyltransferase family 2 protein [Bacteroidia bacterium]